MIYYAREFDLRDAHFWKSEKKEGCANLRAVHISAVPKQLRTRTPQLKEEVNRSLWSEKPRNNTQGIFTKELQGNIGKLRRHEVQL